MAIELKMPALSPTMEEGTLAKWLVKEGDEVKSGDVIAEIEPDKATMEFEAVDEGKIGKILVTEGSAGVKVNTPIAVLLEEGESADDIGSASAAKPADELHQRRPAENNTRAVRGANAASTDLPTNAPHHQSSATTIPARLSISVRNGKLV